ncbi:MAG: Fe(3+) ABC transporter substrate-binding protein [Planctomycetota bacterium JB042]
MSCPSLLLFAALSLAAADPVDDVSGEVNVYSSRHYDTDRELYRAFEEETGIAVRLVEASGDALLARIRSEGANSPCDLYVTVDAGRLHAAEAAGLFEPLRSERLEGRVPEHLRHSQGHWFALTKRARCIFYARSAVRPEELSTYEALADPKWKGRVLIRSSSNVYNQSLVGSLLARVGEEATEEWARGLVANLARKPQGGDTDQIRAVAAGEGDLAVANSYYYAKLMKSDDPADREVVEKVGIFFPNQGGRGTHVNVSGAGIVKTAKNEENARRLLEFLLSDASQRMLARGNNEFPVVPGVEPDDVVKPWLEFEFDTETPVEELGRRNKQAILLMDRVGWR